jgi:hypothetical protein
MNFIFFKPPSASQQFKTLNLLYNILVDGVGVIVVVGVTVIVTVGVGVKVGVILGVGVKVGQGYIKLAF